MFTIYREAGEVKMSTEANPGDLVGAMIFRDGDHYPTKIAEFATHEDGMKCLVQQENKVRRSKTFSGGWIWEVEAYYMESEDGDVDFLC